MKEIYGKLHSRNHLVIWLLVSFVAVGLSQNVRTPECRKEFSNCSISEYTKIVNSDPLDPSAYFNRGHAYYRQKKFEEAVADISIAIELNSTMSVFYRFRGYVYSHQKEYDQAIADFSNAIGLDPKDHNSYYSRGAAYHAKNEYDEAAADYGKAIELAPKDWVYYYVRGWFYYNSGKSSLAETDFIKAKELENLEDNQDAVRLVQPTYPEFPTER